MVSVSYTHLDVYKRQGTTCTLVANVLRAAGYRTGLYTSPYVLDFRERFRINGEMISKDDVIDEVARVASVAERLEAAGETVTEFEFITAMALDWFARQSCDFAVLEVGLGGRMDATNVIGVPEAAAIASISLDHTACLLYTSTSSRTSVTSAITAQSPALRFCSMRTAR